MGVVFTLKFKMAASSAWPYLEILDHFYLTYLKPKQIARAPTKRPCYIRTHVSITAI